MSVVPGTYQLRGIPETAAAIVLYADGNFDFYYSYGAVDRHAYGSWSEDASALQLTTAYPEANGFVLLEAKHVQGGPLTVQLEKPDHYYPEMLHVFAMHGKNSEEQIANRSGILQFQLPAAEKLLCVHEFFPDRLTELAVEENANYFLIKPTQEILLIHFEDVQARYADQTLQFSLPVLKLYHGNRDFNFEFSGEQADP